MKKYLSFFMGCMMVFAILSLPVSAFENESEELQNVELLASSYFSGITVKMNSLNGKPSSSFNISSGSIPLGSEVSGVSLNITVSSGSSPFYIVVKEPNGYYDEQYVSSSGTVSFTQFNNLDPTGTWQVYIRTTGIVSTATASMTVNYTY